MKIELRIEALGARASVILACLVALAAGFAGGAIYTQTVGVRAECPTILSKKPPERFPL